LFKETSLYDPDSPYSASKAGSDHFLRATVKLIIYSLWFLTVLTTMALTIFRKVNSLKLINKKTLLVYGDGLYTRDWLYLIDHSRAINFNFMKVKKATLIILAALTSGPILTSLNYFAHK
jgi:dTDP-glucose 4,6-dehydratase